MAEAKCNLDMVDVFQKVILQKETGAHTNIKTNSKIKQRLKLWSEGRHLLLVEAACRNIIAHRSQLREPQTTDEVNRRANNLVLAGKIRQARRCLSQDDDCGGPLDLDSTDEKDNKTVREVLAAKHPAPREPGPHAMSSFSSTPEFHPVVFDKADITKLAGKLSGSGGLDGLDAQQL